MEGMLIVANWKAYVDTQDKAKKLCALAKRLSTRIKRVKIVLVPPAPFVGILAKNNRSKVRIGAQDVSATTVAADTGEITAQTLKNVGAQYVVIGHSERRKRGESDADVVEKVRRTLSVGLTPIVCVGEKERDQDAQYLRALKEQISAVYAPLSVPERLKVVLAYEPIWAIGKTGEEAIHAGDLTEMVLYIKKVLTEFLMGKSVEKAVILYGGSVEPENIRALAGGSGVDGFLVGHASVDEGMFSALVVALR